LSTAGLLPPRSAVADVADRRSATYRNCLSDNCENIALSPEEQFVVADFEFFTGIRQKQHFVPFLDLEGSAGAIVEEFSVADADDRPASGFIFGGVGQIETAFGLFFGGLTSDDNAVSERLQFGAFA
jgi:hypothetical protein